MGRHKTRRPARRTTKAENQRHHAKKRFGERLGLSVSDRELEQLVRSIQSGKATFVHKRTNRISLFDVELDGRSCRVVYDKQRKTIVTVLTPQRSPHDGDDRSAS